MSKKTIKNDETNLNSKKASGLNQWWKRANNQSGNLFITSNEKKWFEYPNFDGIT